MSSDEKLRERRALRPVLHRRTEGILGRIRNQLAVLVAQGCYGFAKANPPGGAHLGRERTGESSDDRDAMVDAEAHSKQE
jgi:hypothetical protein